MRNGERGKAGERGAASEHARLRRKISAGTLWRCCRLVKDHRRPPCRSTSTRSSSSSARSETSIEDAINVAISRANETIRQLRWFEAGADPRPHRGRQGPALSGGTQGRLYHGSRRLRLCCTAWRLWRRSACARGTGSVSRCHVRDSQRPGAAMTVVHDTTAAGRAIPRRRTGRTRPCRRSPTGSG